MAALQFPWHSRWVVPVWTALLPGWLVTATPYSSVVRLLVSWFCNVKLSPKSPLSDSILIAVQTVVCIHLAGQHQPPVLGRLVEGTKSKLQEQGPEEPSRIKHHKYTEWSWHEVINVECQKQPHLSDAHILLGLFAGHMFALFILI